MERGTVMRTGKRYLTNQNKADFEEEQKHKRKLRK